MTDEAVSGGALLARALAAHGTEVMFGMGGFQLLPMYGAVAKAGITHHLINDERVGAFAADAYARVSGRPGVCDATLGPGATNLATALVESNNAGIPIIAVTGDSHRRYSGRHMTQEARQLDILRPAAKEVLRVEHPERIPELVRRAFTVATAGRCGPVVLDVPEDVAHAVVEFDPNELWVDPRTTTFPARRVRPDDVDVEAAVDVMRRAQRPVILAGGGIHLSAAYAQLDALADLWGAPIAHTISGKGAVACTDPKSVGVFGRYSRTANDLIAKADCLLAVGCKLGEVATERYALLPHGVPLIHVDVDPAEFGRTARHSIGVWGDAALALDDLAGGLLGGIDGSPDDYEAEYKAGKQQWRASVEDRLRSDDVPINVARLCDEINEVMPANGVVVADGGFAAHWTALLYDTQQAGRGYVADRGFASIGYGVPGALGVSLGNPGAPVIALTGDGGLNMSLGDLETLRRVGAPVVIVVVNNAASGYVKALQHLVNDGNYQSADLCETDYAATAEAMGVRGVRVEDPSRLRGVLHEALQDRSGPIVVDVIVTRDPAKMLPGVDSRTRKARQDDRIA